MDKFNLVVRAARELMRAVQENYYNLSDLNIINYSEVCDWCNFPDLQDGGIYEQAIDAAAKIIIAERIKINCNMENNKSQFKRTGVLHDGAECIEIQISHSGNAARYVSTIKFTVKDPEVTRGRWQEIRYSKRHGYAYIVKYGKRLYLHKFLRITNF